MLSNEYKGENITNLFVEPSSAPFDTFDSLVENNYDIRSSKGVLPDIDLYYLKKTANVKTVFSRNEWT